MDELEALLRQADPALDLSEYAVELAVEVARATSPRPRRTLLIGIAAFVGGSLVLGGGLAAAAQAGWFGPKHYVDGPDMAGVRSVTSGGVRYECEYTLYVDADYTSSASYQRIRDGVVEAHRYMRTLDPRTIKIDPKIAEAYGDPSLPTSPEQKFEQWSHSVLARVDSHLSDLKYPGVAMETQLQCEPAK
ncbi:MAG: hypothetical protein ABIP33_08085 [Pseudolysinimonas sp.]